MRVFNKALGRASIRTFDVRARHSFLRKVVSALCRQ